jgi:hypothetical protein
MQFGGVLGCGPRILGQEGFQRVQSSGGLGESSLAGMQNRKP